MKGWTYRMGRVAMGVALCALAAGCSQQQFSAPAPDLFKAPFPSGASLKMTNISGTIHISTADQTQLTVKAWRHVSVLSFVLDPFAGNALDHLTVQLSGGSTRVEIASVWDQPESANLVTASVDYYVVVPKDSANAKLTIDQKAGDLFLDGLNGTSAITLNAGAISFINAGGSLDASVDAGSLTASFTTPPALSDTIKCQVGAGSAAPESPAVDLTLPAASAFDLDAQTDVGNITCDFPQAQVDHPVPAEHVFGTINTGGARVTIDVDSGNIAIRKQ